MRLEGTLEKEKYAEYEIKLPTQAAFRASLGRTAIQPAGFINSLTSEESMRSSIG